LSPLLDLSVPAMHELLARNRRILDQHLQVGDTLTHTDEIGCMEEHVFVGRDGLWLLGTPTVDTLRIGGRGNAEVPVQISALTITHLNRVPLERVPVLDLIRHARNGTL
jgi:hypothetical protein